MTYSIVARDPGTGELGIAVASRFFAVGGIVPHMAGSLGAIATQAFVSPLYGTKGLEMLRQDLDPKNVINRLTSMDRGSDQRQVHLIDAHGRNAAFTGSKCIDWAGHLLSDNVSVAGNMLAGPQVVQQTLRAFEEAKGQPLADRLLTAMQAGEDAGGDKRGKQSAALKIFRGEDYPYLDIRVDDHADPLSELRRLYKVAQERYLYVVEIMPSRQNPSGLTARKIIDDKIAAAEAKRLQAGEGSASYATGPAL